MRGDLDEGLKGVEVDEEKLANLIKRRKTYCDITQVRLHYLYPQIKLGLRPIILMILFCLECLRGATDKATENP